MRIKFVLGLIAFLCVYYGSAQNSDKAKSLLKEVTAKAKSYKNIQIDFKYELTNKEEHINQETRGDVILSGDKYVLNLLGATRMYDGKKIYTIVPENEEITISKKSTEDINDISPQKILSFYEEGYRYEWDILQDMKGRKIQYVKLIPIDSKAEVKYVMLGIDNATKHIYNLIQMDRNGTSTTLTVNSLKTDQKLSDSLFVFDRKKYEDLGYYIDEVN